MTENRGQHESPPWSVNTKFIVTVAAIILVIYIVYRFQSLFGQIVGAAILAYILNPIIIFIDKRTPLKRGTSILIVYVLLAFGVITAITALSIAAIEQITALIKLVPIYITNITDQILTFLAETPEIELIGGFTIDLSTLNLEIITDQVLGMVNPVVGQSTQIIQSAAGATFSWISAILFIFVISIYIAIEIPQLRGHVSRFAHLPGYQKDAERLMREFGRIWSAYLRGQVILGFVIFLIVWIGLAIMGVQNAFALGILSGLLEFIPILGPVIGAGAAVIVAFFQQTPGLGMESQLTYTLIVLAFMIIIQQVENAVLVPKIVGESLDLHPIIVMVAVFMGSSIAGILGAILATPVFASLKLLGIYAWRKMFDQNPFSRPEEEDPPPAPNLRQRLDAARAKLPQRPPTTKS